MISCSTLFRKYYRQGQKSFFSSLKKEKNHFLFTNCNCETCCPPVLSMNAPPTEIIIQAKPGYPGYAMGRFSPYDRRWSKGAIDRRPAADPNVEWRIFESALEAARKDILDRISDLNAQEDHEKPGGPLTEARDIFSSHIMMLEDPAFSDMVKAKINHENIICAAAVDEVIDGYITTFQNMNDEHIRSKTLDLHDIKRALFYQFDLLEERSSNTKDTIVWADHLTPHEVFELKERRIPGFSVTNSSPSSHDMIIAAALQIPSLYGVSNVPEDLPMATQAIIDSHKGLLILNPSEKTRLEYAQKIKNSFQNFSFGMQNRRLRKTLEKLPDEFRTMCNEPLSLSVNLEFAGEVNAIPPEKFTGVGLCRSEFLFSDVFHCPAERQKSIYASILKYFHPHPVVFRLFDINPEKTPLEPDDNPASLYSIRYLLHHPQLLKEQLRALLEASLELEADNNLHILIPMVTMTEEVAQVSSLCHEIAKELKIDKKRFPKIGVMLETPAAIDIIKQLNKYADFYSVGTNDLLQFLTATNRNIDSHRYIYDPLHESLLTSLERIIKGAGKIPVTICGEIASHPDTFTLLLALGFRSFSIAPSHLAQIAQKVPQLSIDKARETLKKIRSAGSLKERNILLKSVKKQETP